MRFAIVLASVLGVGAGCEQWKAPERVDALEKKVADLQAEMATLKPDSDKPKDGDEKTVAKDDKHGDKDAHGDKDKHDDKDKHELIKADERAKADEHLKGKDKPDEKADEKADDKPDEKDEHAKADEHGKPEKADAHDEKPTSKGPPHWTYFGKEGPEKWASLDPKFATCGEGEAQSPIDINPQKGTASPIQFSYKPTKASVVDTGHTLQVNFEPGSSMTIDGHAYKLVQFHVHTPSEHEIAGERFPMEVHLVHKDDDGKLSVVGVLYDVGPESKELDPVWSKWPKKANSEVKLRKPFDPSKLLPETKTLYRYDGSLTTPPCSEGVLWNVMRRTMTDTNGHMEKFRRKFDSNSRPVQPLNERAIQ